MRYVAHESVSRKGDFDMARNCSWGMGECSKTCLMWHVLLVGGSHGVVGWVVVVGKCSTDILVCAGSWWGGEVPLMVFLALFSTPVPPPHRQECLCYILLPVALGEFAT